MSEYSFDTVILEKESDSNAIIKVELDGFSSKNDANSSFPGGVLKISANVDGKVYSKTMDGLTDKHVEAMKPEKSDGYFKVVLKKKQKFNVADIFSG